jgi:hypothetical protein
VVVVAAEEFMQNRTRSRAGGGGVLLSKDLKGAAHLRLRADPLRRRQSRPRGAIPDTDERMDGNM